MIVWGGYAMGFLNTGGRYDPAADSWTATSTTAAPSQRDRPTAVWTGTEMIVWGGESSSGMENTGFLYCPTLAASIFADGFEDGHTLAWSLTEP
jgi:hypothetical protein